MLSQKLANVVVRMKKLAHTQGGQLHLDPALTDALLTNLIELADRLEEFEHSSGPIPIGDCSLSAIERAIVVANATRDGRVVSIADRRTAHNLRNDLPPDGGSVA